MYCKVRQCPLQLSAQTVFVNPTGADGVGVTSLIYLLGSDGMTVNQSRVCSVDMVVTYKT